MPPAPSPEPPAWRSRGYLPHVDGGELVQMVTFRLADALPEHVVTLVAERFDPRALAGHLEEQRSLDRGHGACWLARPRVARIVEDALLFFDDVRYRLLAWVVMPNHVHVLVAPLGGEPLARIVCSWKTYAARHANAELGRSGAFWYREYYDRYIRDARHFEKARQYIENNPVRARLVDLAKRWPFGSARRVGTPLER